MAQGAYSIYPGGDLPPLKASLGPLKGKYERFWGVSVSTAIASLL